MAAAAASATTKEFPVLAGSLDDLSCMMMGIRERVIRMAAKISSVPVDEALEVLIRRKTIPVTPTDTLLVPAVVHPMVPMYAPPPAPPTTATTSCRSKVQYFQNGMRIPRLESMRVWDPSTHCHGRKRIGFCGRKIAPIDEEDRTPLCKQCRGIYAKHKAGIPGGWRGFVTEPFIRSMNPKEYDAVKKTGEGNTYVNTDGVRVMCKWYYSRYYWPYYHESVGMVYYDMRSGQAIKKLPVDWDRGHPSDQTDPIRLCDSSEILDLRDHLSEQGWDQEG